MAEIKILGRREPLHVAEAVARSIKKRKFEDPKAADSDLVDLGFWSGSYGQIVAIELGMDTVTRKPHWALFSPSRGTIWKQSFQSHEEAEAELKFQELGMPLGRGHDWVIQEKSTN